MKVSRYSPKINTPLLEKAKPVPPRSPQEVEMQHHAEIAAQAFIDARIDFLYNVGEDAARKHTRHLLESKP